MTKKYQGSCLCQAVQFEVEGEFEHFFLCHCQYCQKDTGSAHAANLFSSTAKLVWHHGQEQLTRFQLPDTRHVRSFCRVCGSALPTLEGKLLAVPAGSLDIAIDVKPNAHLFDSSRASWCEELNQLPTFDTFPQ
ncbi:GFA family protein [uncultured Shewanella sp.]|uniref:GFA family protein n=1 Tax=uncultured Shewanella sp. TaxID=173975 RepID=UPI002603E15D|nr:GFA family protein [uncultured Shewanella sp.]